jgi:hypothetical protein
MRKRRRQVVVGLHRVSKASLATASEGFVGATREGLGVANKQRAAGHCNKTVAKPYLLGGKGDQLRAKAESPKIYDRIGGKGIIN